MRHSRDELIKKFKKAVINYNMLDNADPVMVGLSGGKDSIALLFALKYFLNISKYKFPLAAGHISLGFNDDYPQALADYCADIDVPFFFEKSDIAKIVFEIRQETNPCSLCAKMRRGALNNLALKNGYHKIALGHHQDDVVETMLLKTFFEGNIACFKPVTYLDRSDITVIRPLIYCPEELVAAISKNYQLPIIPNPCPADGFTKREKIKKLLKTLTDYNPEAKERAISALEKLYGANWDGKNQS